MLDNIFGNLQVKKEELENKLKETNFDISSPNEMVTIKANGKGNWLDIKLNNELINSGNLEELEDTLITMVEQINEKSASLQLELQQQLIGDMMPGGMDLDQIKNMF